MHDQGRESHGQNQGGQGGDDDAVLRVRLDRLIKKDKRNRRSAQAKIDEGLASISLMEVENTTTEDAFVVDPAPELATQDDSESVASNDLLESPENLRDRILAVCAEVDASVGRVTAGLRDQLLPLLIEAKKLVGHGNWRDYLISCNLNPNTVRSWFHRERASAREVGEILGGHRTHHRKPELTQSSAVELAHAAKSLATAATKSKCLCVDCQQVKRMAFEYLEAYEGAF